MDSRLRHDLRHPISTISMIASAVVEFSEGMTEDLLASYAAQVHSEYESLVRLVAESGVTLDVGALGDAQAGVDGDSSLDVWGVLAARAQHVLELLDGGSSVDAPSAP